MAPLPNLTLYRSDGACSIVCNALIRDLEIPHDAVRMKLGPNGVEPVDGSFTAASYRNIHHSGKVPALTVDGTPLIENAAILNFIASLTPQSRALTGGEDLLNRAYVISWMAWLSGTLHSHGGGFSMMFVPSRFTDKEEHHAMVQEKGRAFVRSGFAIIEKHLADRDYFVGDDVTIVDYNSLTFWLWGNRHGFEMKKNYPNFGKLIQKMEARKGVREALLDEKQVISFD